MKIKSLLNSKIFGILCVFLISLAFSMNAHAQCTYCSATTSSQYEYISRVQLNTIDNSSSWNSGVADYTSKSTDLKISTDYTLYVTLGNGYYYDQVHVFFDWNQDCDFDDAGEDIYVYPQDYYGYSYIVTINVPSTAKSGTTRMRVRMCDEYWNYTYACGSSQYGDVEDYSVKVIIPAPDASVNNIITPTSPYNEGTYPVSMVLGNNGDANLASCTVNWSVNGVTQTPYNYSGSLKKGNTVQISLGNYSFVYPDGGPYDPFKVRVWLTNIVGESTTWPDLDATNNEKTVNSAPSTEDAQPVVFTQPSSAFIPGNVDIYVLLRNNARKPLSVCDIEWYVDGTKQGTKKWFGSLSQGQTEEVFLGTYNFYFKTPLAAFQVQAHTLNPNGVTDPISSNDWITKGLAPSLIAGTYYIGGAGAHFLTMTDAVSYLNASGIIGDGDVYMKINNGTYNEQVMLTSFPHGNNKFYFESTSGNASDVILTYAPPYYDNYIFGINGMDEITFRNLTFVPQDGGAGTAVNVSNANDISFNNVIFNGVNNAPNSDYSIVVFNDVTNAAFSKCKFNNGYNSIYAYYWNTKPSMNITGCTFLDYANYGVASESNYYEGGKINNKGKSNNIQASYPIVVENNVFAGVNANPQGGIQLYDAALVRNNSFSNFYSSNYGYSAISVDAQNSSDNSLIEKNNGANLTGVSGIIYSGNGALITNNNMTNSANGGIPVVGLYLSGYNIEAVYNKLNITGTTSSASAGIYATYANGLIANNLSVIKNGYAFVSSDGNDLNTYYNTLISTSNTFPAAYFMNGNNSFQRNIVCNYGTGNSVINDYANVSSANNNFWTKGGTNVSDLATWKSITGDLSSYNITLELRDDGTYQFVKFYPEMLSNYPLGLPGTVETFDYYNQDRTGYYYAGYAGISLAISVGTQPLPVLACNGEKDRFLQTSAKITYGAKANYQWQRDGVNINGATDPIYTIPNFTYETSGTYRCLISGPANTSTGVFTDEVLVYTLRPTEITKQPTDQTAMLGGTVFFDVEVHIKGIVAPYFQHKYQWWRHYNNEEVQLMDNEYYANTTSPVMTITNLQDKHFNGDNDYYYCVIEGQCGKVISDPVKLNITTGEIVFDVQPLSTNACIANSVTLTSSAKIVGSNDPLDFQWYFKGQALIDGDGINGSKTNTLNISSVGPDDEGVYYCEASSSTLNKLRNSDEATITVNMPPTIDMQPQDQQLKEGENLYLWLEASGFEEPTYQWFKDDVLITGATTSELKIEGVTLDHTGFYYCNVENSCGTTKSTVVQVVVTKDGGIQSITESNPINLKVNPNPAVSDIKVSFTLERDSQTEIAILDMTGKKIAVKQLSAQSGDNLITMTLGQNIASGSYFVQVTYNGKSVTQQIVVKK